MHGRSRGADWSASGLWSGIGRLIARPFCAAPIAGYGADVIPGACVVAAQTFDLGARDALR
ncbi:hypothetical protein [Cupriavidus lacunae]|uniref:hypothetical protein n=1 Tax=Cupriavidus lacunae TaxID=2666307 RepID=UPI001058858E|nr:hypothetical protein [Cupriavidus lacunae]